MVHSPKNTRQQRDKHLIWGKRYTQAPVACPGKRSPTFLWPAAAISNTAWRGHFTQLEGKGSLQSKELAHTSHDSPLSPATPNRYRLLTLHSGAKAPKRCHRSWAHGQQRAHSDKRHAGHQEGLRVCTASCSAGAQTRATVQSSTARSKLVLTRIQPAHKREITQRKSETTWKGWRLVFHPG